MRPSTIGWRGLLACMAIACLALAMTSAPALAKGEKNPDDILHKEDFLKFQNCPMEVAKACLYGETLEGEFKLGNKTTTLVNPTILQGGLAFLGAVTLPLLPPRFGADEVSKSPQPVPGGLTGVSELIGGPVNATAEQAGTIIVTATNLGFGHDTAVEFPIKIHLENENLGPNCYIGSDAEPVVLKLTDGTTKPPEGVEPMTGKIGVNKGIDKARIAAFYNNTLVDNTFEVPGSDGLRRRRPRTGAHGGRQRRNRPALHAGHEPRDPDRQPVHGAGDVGLEVRQEGPEGERKRSR